MRRNLLTNQSISQLLKPDCLSPTPLTPSPVGQESPTESSGVTSTCLWFGPLEELQVMGPLVTWIYPAAPRQSPGFMLEVTLLY